MIYLYWIIILFPMAVIEIILANKLYKIRDSFNFSRQVSIVVVMLLTLGIFVGLGRLFLKLIQFVIR